MMYYNGIELPDLPEWDEITYPCAVVVHNIATNAVTVYGSEYVLACGTSINWNNGNLYLYGKGLLYNSDGSEWILKTGDSSGTVMVINSENYNEIIWTKTTISTADGASIFLEGSVPTTGNSGTITPSTPMKEFVMGFLCGLVDKNTFGISKLTYGRWFEDDIDAYVGEHYPDVDTGNKFILTDSRGNITIGYPLDGVPTGMAYYNGVLLPDIGNASTHYIFKRDADNAYIYVCFNRGCETYSYIMWDEPRQQYSMVRREDEPIYYSIYVLENGVWKYEDGNGTGSGISLGRACIGELIWAGSDVYNADDTVLHYASSYTYVPSGDAFTITSYDPATTEFKARCWLRVSYRVAGEMAGKPDPELFIDTESGGMNYIKNIRYCTLDGLYYNGEEIWPVK